MKKTVIIGATTDRSRYAYIAASMLTSYNHEIVPIGIKKGELFGTHIQDIYEKPDVGDVDTITLYIGPQRQPEWYDYMLSLKPKRIIFNPGTENDTFEQMASDQGVEVVHGCTLVMLRSGQY
ncbi:MAG TPA: CoA-binding protein [Chryseosolibacter sp.]|nr:CoA-binding protein [Chryseosolibacter sp.]